MKGLHYVAMDPNIAGDPKVATMAKRLRKDRHWVAGHFPQFFGEVAVHCPDGNLAEADDDLLDQWAGGVKGWGALVRELLCENNTLSAWRKYNGKSLEKLKADRERKRGNSTEIPRRFPRRNHTIPYQGENPSGFPLLEGEISPNGRAA